MNARIVFVLVSCVLSIATGLVLSRGKGGAEVGGTGSGKPVIGLSMDTLKEERWIAVGNASSGEGVDLGAQGVAR